jgi:hypothetical protein
VNEPYVIDFATGSSALAIELHSYGDIESGCVGLGLATRPTLVLIGGAGGLGEREAAQIRPLFVETVAPLIEALGAQVVDGGTDAGVMRIMGGARAELASRFPLVGVAAADTVAAPGTGVPAEAARLEPNHSHFLLVAGSGWGSETPWIARVATVLAGEHPSLTLLVNGGDISWDDALQSVAAKRLVVAVAGSGGTADAVVAQLRGAEVDRRARHLAASGLVLAAERMDGAGSVGAIVDRLLRGGT